MHIPSIRIALFLLVAAPLSAEEYAPPFAEGDAVSLRALPDAGPAFPGRAVTGDFNGDLLPDYVVLDLVGGHISVMWEPGIKEDLDHAIASAVDVGVKPGDGQDELLIVDSEGLKLLTFSGSDWISTLIAASWSGVVEFETYTTAAGVFKAIGLSGDRKTLLEVSWDGGATVSQTLFTVPVPVQAIAPFRRSGTPDPGIAAMTADSLALFTAGGTLIAYHSNPSGSCDAVVALSHSATSADHLAWVATVPGGGQQYLTILDEAGVIHSMPPLWSDRDVANVTAVDHDQDGNDDVVFTFEDFAKVTLLPHQSGEPPYPVHPTFDKAAAVDLAPPGGGLVQYTNYLGMAACADMDADGDHETLHATPDGRLVVFLNVDAIDANEMRVHLGTEERAPDAMLVEKELSAGLAVRRDRFYLPDSLPYATTLEIKVFRQASESSQTASEPVTTIYKPIAIGQTSVWLDRIDLDGSSYADEFDGGQIYYLSVRCIRRLLSGQIVAVFPAENFALHASKNWVPDGHDPQEDYLDDYLASMAGDLWVDESFAVDPFEQGANRVGSGSIVYAIPDFD